MNSFTFLLNYFHSSAAVNMLLLVRHECLSVLCFIMQRYPSCLCSSITAFVASMAGIQVQPGDIAVSYLFACVQIWTM